MKRHINAGFTFAICLFVFGLINWLIPDGYTWSRTPSSSGNHAQEKKTRGGSTGPQAASSQPELSAMFVVNNITDEHDTMPGDGICNSGTGCSLRAAIEESNALLGADTITFNIPGSGAHTITPAMPLPQILDPVTIDATTQPGFMGNPLIELNGNNAGPGNGLDIFAGGSVVRGLVINRFDGNGIGINGGGNNIIERNFIGTDISGTISLGNSQNGILITSGQHTIGGTSASARNLISGNGSAGIRLNDSTAIGCLIQGNFIGTTVSGTSALGNTGDGIDIFNASNNTIGGSTAGAGNTIAFNGGFGVFIVGSATRDSLLRNPIFSNGGLGIGLNDDGVTPNDPGDLDTGPNDLQNFPVLTAAFSNGSSTVMQGTLNSVGNTLYRIEFFSNPTCDPSGNGEGQTFIGSTSVMTDSGGNAAINVTLPVGVSLSQVVTSTATDPTGNTSEFSECVAVMPLTGCIITCPANLTVSADPDQCGAVVNYSEPITTGNCSPAICVPPSGSFFPVGDTLVTCSVLDGGSCTFNVTVKDDTPPTLTCPGDIVTSAAPERQSAVVNYPLPRVTDNCPGTTVVCVPPSGREFALGVTTITCTAKDLAGNQSVCQFKITVQDGQAPTIACPSNVMVDAATGQNSVVVNYPDPLVTDNMPGTTVVCAPPSGSAFPIGITTVICTATDNGGNTAVCRFTVTVNRGGAQIDVKIEDGKQAVEFGDTSPVKPRRKNKKKTPCEMFSIENLGFLPVTLTLDSIFRAGSDVENGKISDADDPYFTLSLIGANGSETSVDRGDQITIGPEQSVDLCVRFDPLFPAVTDRTTQLSASDAVPDLVTSRIVFLLNDNQQAVVNIIGHVATGLKLINATNPRKPAQVTFTKSGGEFVLTYSVYDPDLDVSQARYELLGGNGQASQTFDVDLAQPLGQLGLVKGQSFTVRQRFTGANDHPEITGVRLSVTDGETSVTATTGLGSQATAAASLLYDDSQNGTRAIMPALRLVPGRR